MIGKTKIILLALLILINSSCIVSASELNLEDENYIVLEDEAIPLSSVSALQPKLNTVSIIDIICTLISITMCLVCLSINKLKKYVIEIQPWQILVRSITVLPAFMSVAFIVFKENISGSITLFSNLSIGMILYSLSSIALTVAYVGSLKSKYLASRRLSLND